jgi:GNAT superfamily N-acetyltransferase
MIRQARTTDCSDLLALIAEHAAFERSAATLVRSDLLGILSGETGPVHLIVAAVQGQLLGYAAVTFDFSLWRARRWAHLDCLFVSAASRGQSIGTKLLGRAVTLARQTGADRIEWQTPAWNERAIRFYERQAAVPEHKIRFGLDLLTER